MRRSSFGPVVLLAAGGLAFSACGGSSSTSPTPSAAAGASASPSISVPGGSSFCTQVASVVAQLGQISGAFGGTAGSTPSISAYKQLIASETAAIDALDSSAPSQIASSFHTLRSAFDQANSQVQTATSFQQLETSLAPLGGPAVSSAGTAITDYTRTSCGVATSSST